MQACTRILSITLHSRSRKKERGRGQRKRSISHGRLLQRRRRRRRRKKGVEASSKIYRPLTDTEPCSKCCKTRRGCVLLYTYTYIYIYTGLRRITRRYRHGKQPPVIYQLNLSRHASNKGIRVPCIRIRVLSSLPILFKFSSSTKKEGRCPSLLNGESQHLRLICARSCPPGIIGEFIREMSVKILPRRGSGLTGRVAAGKGEPRKRKRVLYVRGKRLARIAPMLICNRTCTVREQKEEEKEEEESWSIRSSPGWV